jgi:hypothetical protein
MREHVVSEDTRLGLLGVKARVIIEEQIFARCTPEAAKCLRNEWARNRVKFKAKNKAGVI